MDILCGISSRNGFFTPANLRMFAEIACGFCIRRIEVATDFSAISFTLAIRSSTLEDVYSAVFDIFNGGYGLKKNIDGRYPFLRESIYISSLISMCFESF